MDYCCSCCDYCVGGGRFATLAGCLAGISETEARSLGGGAVAVLKSRCEGCGWLGMMMMLIFL
jgi:hypothetical protein